MNVNVSAPIRIFAAVGGLAALALGAWFFFLGGLSPAASTEPAKVIKPLYGGKKASAVQAPTSKPKAPAKTAPKAKAAAKAKAVPSAPASKPKPKPAPKPTSKPAAPRVPNPERLPPVVARALTRHAVVVVSLYSPEAKVDRISLAEARAGARRADVGFVALDVLDRRASEALTRKLGVLSAPAFFLYRRPGDLVMRVDGFADRDLVAQAARNAASFLQ